MGLFGSSQKPDRLFGVRLNQSQYGYPFPVVMGTAQIQQSILWIDGFSSKKAPSGKKGIGGKGGAGYIYSADVVAALCCGPISAIGNVWSGQSWLGNPTSSESYTIGSPYTYTPTYASTYVQDLGVYIALTLSGSYNDLGAPTATTLSGTQNAGLIAIPYFVSGTVYVAGQQVYNGTDVYTCILDNVNEPLSNATYWTNTGGGLTTGEYSVNPSTGQYLFSSADNGTTVQLSYSFLLTTMTQEEEDIVPASKQIQVGGSNKFQNDYGVVYGQGANEGVALTKVSGTPSATGTYSVSGSAPATYKFASGDINAAVVITYSITDPNAVPQGEPTTLAFTLNSGAMSQPPFSFLSASYPDDAFGYTGLATVLYQPMDLGESGAVQENRFEVMTADVFGGGILDCNPVQCIGRVLTNSQWGLGVGPVPFPTACIDNGASGTWGAASATGGVGVSNSTAFNWFAANSFFISPVIDSQDSAASEMGKWLEAGVCQAFYSEGLLKLSPCGQQTCAANGYTWTAPTAYVFAVDDTCFLSKRDDDPVKITRTAAHDAWNAVQIQWNNRSNQYAPEITQDSDQGFINRWGERREDAQDWDFVHTIAAATFSANMRLNRGLYIRNQYEFSLPYSYSYIEPGDIGSISTTSVWAQGLNNLNLGVTNLPVRVIRVVDDPKDGLTLTCEDYPWGAALPTINNKQIANNEVVVDMYADPGSAEVVMFEATNRITGFAGNQIWIGCNGASDNYGWTNIWVSTDNVTYAQIGSTEDTGPARMGTLASAFDVTSPLSDPDTSDSCVINLVENCPAWSAGTDSDADNDLTLTFVDGEIISYSDVVVTGQNQITLGVVGSPATAGYIRRGQMGTTQTAHSEGGLVLRLDDAIFKYTYDPNAAGQTLYFKFQAVNAFGNTPQELSDLTPVTFTIPGENPGSIDASTGVLYPQYNTATYQGAWSNSTAYVVGNLVDYDGTVYTCTTPNTNETPSSSSSYWQVVGAPNTSVYEGTYNSGTSYVVGNQVTYDGNYYVCVLASTGNAPTNATYWQQISTSETYTGSWSSATTYNVGNQVSYQGSFYICTTANTNQTPSTSSSYWTLLGTSAILIGTWSSLTAYVAGNQVVYNGNVYTCILANTNENPGTATSYWTIVGSQSLASIPPSGSLAKVGTTAFTYSSTTTSITISWSNLTVYQVNGTNLSLGSGSQTITGLTAGTTYSVFPYYNGSAVEFVSSSNVSGLQSLTGVSVAGSGYVSTATNQTFTNSSTHVTIEGWFYPTSGACELIDTVSGPQLAIGLTGSSNSYQLSVNASTGSSGTVFGGTLIANSWNHVVVVFNYGGGGSGLTAITMYVNGVSSTGSQSCNSSTSQKYYIGGGSGRAATTEFSGVLGRVAVYNGTLLSSTQVLNHFNTMLSGGTSAYDTLVAGDGATYYWHLSDTSGTTAIESIDSNPGTYTGTYTLNTTEQIGGANGSPAIAWQTAPIQVTMYQFSQGFTPLIAGGYSVSTPSTGTAVGVLPSFFVPGLPSNIVAPI